MFGLEIPGIERPLNGAFTDLVPEETIEDYKCRRATDLNRKELKTLKLFPKLSNARD